MIGNFGIFYEWWKWLISPAARVVGRHISANPISIGRMLGAIPVVILINVFHLPVIAFVLYLICAVADSFDGQVARERQKMYEDTGDMKYKDDAQLGACMDAVCDKIFILLLAVGLLPTSDYSSLPDEATYLFFVICIAILLTEVWLLAIRLQDYQYEKNTVIPHKERLLNATLWGKLKFLLECVGMGGFIFSQPLLHNWSFYTGLISFAFATPLAWRSLQQKLQARHA